MFQISSFFTLRWFKRLIPKSLYIRTILIIVIPTILTLSVATFVFFDRHWATTTRRLANAIAGDIAVVLSLVEKDQEKLEHQDFYKTVDRKMEISVRFAQGQHLDRHKKRSRGPLNDIINEALNERVGLQHRIESDKTPDYIVISVETDKGVYTFLVHRRRILTPTTEVFIGWMIGSSILLSAIALLFMRNQVRPVRRLAAAAEAIGKGQDVPWFKLEGATEVRQAASALIVMRDRIRRTMNQRTTMLAGVSHDLRTPLTRMKLQLAMMKETPQTRGFQSDIIDMEAMLEAYLAFARGDEAEASVATDIGELLTNIVTAVQRQHDNVTVAVEANIVTEIKPHAMKRCVTNLIGNALRYAQNAHVSMSLRDRALDILVDDDGPGIPPEKREDVFRPFYRMDASRNMETGGVGLGLTIARDIARAHGGNLILENSPQGGLRARIWLPV